MNIVIWKSPKALRGILRRLFKLDRIEKTEKKDLKNKK